MKYILLKQHGSDSDSDVVTVVDSRDAGDGDGGGIAGLIDTLS